MRRIPGLAALAALALASPALANKSAEAQAAFAVGRDADALRLYEAAIAEAGSDPTALAIAKRSFNMDSESIRGIAGMGMYALSLYYDTDESKEGGIAFKEKRKPDFRKYQK